MQALIYFSELELDVQNKWEENKLFIIFKSINLHNNM